MNLYLIGYRGCGKSTVAPLVANRLAWSWLDADEQIELLTGQTIAEIFAEQGEACFRQWETTVIQAFTLKREHVISLGGGAPTVEENRAAIKRSGKTVLLTASPDVLWKRISSDTKSDSTRPNLTDLEGYEEVVNVLQQRAELYAECADYTVDTTSLSPLQVADEIANWFDPVDT